MNKNTICFFEMALALCLCLSSCAFNIENNRRVAVTGSLVDDSGNPISGVLIQSAGDDKVLGHDTSDENGMFSFTSLESNASDFSININPRFLGDTDYLPITYINGYRSTPVLIDLSKGKRNQNSYDLGTIQLRHPAYLDLKIKKTSTANDTLRWTVTLPDNYCENYIFKGDTDTTRTRCFANFTQSGILKPGDEDQNPGFGTIRNAEAIFDYTINSGASQRINIPISQHKTQYIFEF